MEGMRQVDASSPSETCSVKDRLFGTGESDHLRKKVAKARFLAALNVPSGGDATVRSGSVTEPMGQDHAVPPSSDPVRIGRFTVLHKLGQGGMGVVYAAYDEELDRKVALKLLRSALSRDERGRARMLREAKALARFSHPNVVQIHNIGTWQGQDYVAMEFVKGQTLDRWVEAEEPSWSETLAVMISAGRGLAEAHHANLVHRDFKPANILVGEGDRPRVLDFGLARAAGEGPAAADLIETGEDTIEQMRADGSVGDVSRTGSAVFDQLLTATGAVLGTPAYMAPEQHLGRRATELSDQFSFCLVLYEAIFGERPHKSKSRREYAAKVVEGDFTVPGAGSGVPKWLRDAICRGLAPRPEDRWPSMDVLLDELGRERTRRWRQFGVAAGLVAFVGTALVLQANAKTTTAPVCAIDQSVVVDTWNDERRGALAERFLATGLAGAGAVFERTAAGLDAYAGLLVAAQLDACNAHSLEQTQTDAQFELRMACLEQREDELDAALSVLSEVDASTMARSPLVLEQLGDVEMCGQPDALERGVPVPKDTRAAEGIKTARRDIARAAAAREIGRLDDAVLLTADVRARAEQFDYAPLLGEVAVLEADNALTGREYERARKAALRGIVHATKADDDRIATEAWLVLASIYALQGVDPGDAFEVAAAHVEQLGNQPRHQFELHNTRGQALYILGRLDGALAAYDRAVALATEGFPGSERELVRALKRRATVLADMGEAAAVRRDFERALEVGEQLGPESPVVLDTLYNFAVTETEAGELEQAQRHYEKVIAGYIRVFGPNYAYIGHAHLGLAWIANQHNDHERSERQIALALEVLDADHPDHDYALDAAATLAQQMERYDEATEYFRQLVARADASGAAIPRRAYLHGRLGRVLTRDGKHDAALVEFDEATVLFEQADPSLDIVPVLIDRAEIFTHRDELDLAQTILERALELTPLDCGRAIDAALVRVDLARVHRERGDHGSQRLLAREAMKLLESTPEVPLYGIAKALAETSP